MSTSAAALSADERFMGIALDIARRGAAAGEPPVGACVVNAGETIARAHNAIISELDATAHAEIRALREACRAKRVLRLDDCTLYATVEPCSMCLAACFYAGISRVVYGVSIEAMQEITGSELKLQPQLMPGLVVEGGVLAEDCRGLLQSWRPSVARSGG
ncbi:MAG: nucleoside deaminase [Gammaproteobacteria bacterium]